MWEAKKQNKKYQPYAECTMGQVPWQICQLLLPIFCGQLNISYV